MRIANVRRHVERAFRRIKGWHIFDGVIPLSLWSWQSTLSSELFAAWLTGRNLPQLAKLSSIKY